MTESNLKKWKILSSQLVIEHEWCKIRQDQIELPNGRVIDDYFINIRPEIVVILAITPTQEIVFVRQYRHGVTEILLELPAGNFEKKIEDSFEAAQRELVEETGYEVECLIKLATIYDNPVKNNNKTHIFLGINAKKTTVQSLDITEEIEVVLIPIKDIVNQVISGEICVAGTIAAVFMGLEILRQKS
ncbi:MAG TPA: NUDIX hydrolase [Cyanothece sp. UBA12306]|nr:NUDIX hydrolase [Cyanothece sp. UBA12306]